MKSGAGVQEEPIKVHMVWVGPPTVYKHFSGLPNSLNELLELELSKLDIALYSNLPQDIGGFLTFLENEIKYSINSEDEIELYFHCRVENILHYQNIFDTFCKNMMRIAMCGESQRIRAKMPNYKIICFQETLIKISEIAPNLSLVLNAYHNFIHDTRVKNVRDFMNYKDLMFYILLYLYGGYAFDLNVFVHHSIHTSVDVHDDDSVRWGKHEEIYKNLKNFMKCSKNSEFEPILIKEDSGLNFFLHINPFTKLITFLRSPPVKNNAIRFFPLHDQFALCGQRNSKILLDITCFTLKNLIHFAEGLTHCKKLNFQDQDDFNATSVETNEKILYLKTWYFLCSAVCAYLSPVFKNVQNFVASNSFSGETNLAQEYCILEGMHATVCNGNNKLNGIIFKNLPLIKFQKNSHFVKKELIDVNVLQNVCDAIQEHLALVYGTADSLSSVRIDTEKIFIHQTKTLFASTRNVVN